MSRDHGHRRGSSDAEPVFSDIDPAVEDSGEAYQTLRSPHIFLQKLHHVSAAGDVFDRRVIVSRHRIKR